MINCDNRVPN